MSEWEEWERQKITYLSKDLKTIRLGPDEYLVSHIDMIKFQSGDIVEVKIEKGRIIDIRFPAGLEPSQPSKNETEKKLVEEAKNKQEKQYHIVFIGNGKLIVSKGIEEDEEELVLRENALKYQKSFKQGDLIQFSRIPGSDNEIKSLWKVNEDGTRPDKTNWNGNGKQQKVVTIGGTINLQNYENIKIEVSGPYENIEDVKKYQNELKEILQLFGKDEVTKGFVQNYCKRVIGGQV